MTSQVNILKPVLDMQGGQVLMDLNSQEGPINTKMHKLGQFQHNSSQFKEKYNLGPLWFHHQSLTLWNLIITLISGSKVISVL